MSIRTYLTLSYVALIALMCFGMWFMADRSLDHLTQQALTISDQAVQQVTTANLELADQVLTKVGEYVVKDKAEDVARELAYVLKAGPKNSDYVALRRNPIIRKIAVQSIYTPQGQAGYTDLYDRRGYILFHPDQAVEGRNQLDWEAEYPETTELIKRSLAQNNVAGYFTFFDENKRERKRYSVRVHVPGTPFIVAAIVNLDRFFQPTQERIKAANLEILARARTEIEGHHQSADRRIKLGGLIGGLALSLCAILGGLWFAAIISRPIARLRDGVRRVGEGDFSVAVPAKGVKEVIHLAHSFNQLGLQLTEYIEKRDFIRDTFGRYVTQEVVKKLLEDKKAREMGGETREVSLLMSDLRGFTALTADMEPEQIITFLNRYLSKMIEILLDYRAIIDEILGDGILAFFGAPEPLEDHPLRAVACALEMQAAMDEINFINAADGLPHLEMGIAVDTGAVVVGNIGSERRAKYSVVGAHVNYTSRIEAFAVGGQVLISAATFQKVRDHVDLREVLNAEMKGIPGQVQLYDIRGIAGPYNLQLKERCESLTPLTRPLQVQLQRIQEKIVIGTATGVITHLCETRAAVRVAGELGEWEDVRVILLDEQMSPIPGKIYGKVTAVKPADDNLREAAVRFTSVAPEMHRLIREAVGIPQ
jgi:class 3 adenylate cyclase/HAMP domain-containing protein